MEVKAITSFKRGISSKESLTIGKEAIISKINQWMEDMNPEGLLSYNDQVSILCISLSNNVENTINFSLSDFYPDLRVLRNNYLRYNDQSKIEEYKYFKLKAQILMNNHLSYEEIESDEYVKKILRGIW